MRDTQENKLRDPTHHPAARVRHARRPPPAAATSILPSPALIAAGLEPDALEPGLAREQPLERS